MSHDRSSPVGSISPIRDNQSEAIDETSPSKSYWKANCRKVVLLVPTECEKHVDFIQPKEWHVCGEGIWDVHPSLRKNVACQSVDCKTAHERGEK